MAPDGRTAVVANGLTTGRAGELLRPGQEELLVVTLADGKVVGRGVEVDGNAAYVLVFGKGVDRMDLDTGASTPVLDLTCALGRREYEVESMILATDARKLLLGTSTGGVLVVPL